MTLNNNVRPYQPRKQPKRRYSDKPCPQFTTTGACSRGLTCMYQHNPDKIAICWPFLQGTCPNNAETCNLSHDPTPQRTPLCMHFANNGRCTRGETCPFPHVRLGPRQGVCRDFAVLGYCDKGLDCDKNHVRECPDFAEKGACQTKGCKLPHVIRANRNRKPAASASSSSVKQPQTGLAASVTVSQKVDSDSSVATDSPSSFQPAVSAEDAQLGDEYISLTFHEEDESEEDSEEDDDEEDGDDEEKKGESPNDDDDGEVFVHG
ncbi:hypothetical protein JAAARDRAFT_31166 [Jaapia argillacea MUCL 33604]|uniref:C3H1-type domain-containing protein n=1 Tax=Jaapia argillacea MUCL 33604 TaxID=933084 RepID=A0A067Q697_9AGAM|nr:hypothetical protein JAAARDRAFT_31166 [Jaapia argillacea MUCL 33604]